MATIKEVPRPGYKTVVGFCGIINLVFLYCLCWIVDYTGKNDDSKPENWTNRPGAKFLVFFFSCCLIPLSLFALYLSAGKNTSYKDWKTISGKWLHLQRGVIFLELVACDIAPPHLLPHISYTMAFHVLAIVAMSIYRIYFIRKCKNSNTKSINNSK